MYGWDGDLRTRNRYQKAVLSRIRAAVWGKEMLKTQHFPLTPGFRLQVCSLVLVRVAAVMVKASAESPELMWTGACCQWDD